MGIGSKRKAYVRVISETDEQGRVTPLAVVWRHGERSDISRSRARAGATPRTS